MFHRTQRLFLRPVFPEDWEAIFTGIADQAVVRNLARAPWPYSEQDAKDFAARGHQAGLPGFVIMRPSARGEQLIGCIGLSIDSDSPTGAIELGYWIARPHWGSGYATEAARGVVDVARMLGLKHLTAGHFLDNPASGRVLEKAGFRPSGPVTDRYSSGRGTMAPIQPYALDLTLADGSTEAAAAEVQAA